MELENASGRMTKQLLRGAEYSNTLFSVNEAITLARNVLRVKTDRLRTRGAKKMRWEYCAILLAGS